jgi:hypothetical protein
VPVATGCNISARNAHIIQASHVSRLILNVTINKAKMLKVSIVEERRCTNVPSPGNEAFIADAKEIMLDPGCGKLFL